MTDHEATAKRIIDEWWAHGVWTPGFSSLQNLITAALAERDRHYAINVLPEKDRQYEELKAERDNWKARFRTMEQFWSDLKAEVDEARKEPERLYYEYEQNLQILNAENEELKAENDAAEAKGIVKGLERAKEIMQTERYFPFQGIMVEIDKLKGV